MGDHPVGSTWMANPQVTALIGRIWSAAIRTMINYAWTRLAPVTVGQWHWLQTIVLINPLIYVNEGMRAAFTNAPHMHLYVIYPVLLGFWGVFLWLGLRNFRRRVLS